MNNTQRAVASVGGALFGLFIPLAGVSGSTLLMAVYWTVVLFIFGAYVCQEMRGAFTKKE